jgi:predicted dehydrogenase
MPLRIGLIGAGANTRTMHVPGFRKCPDVEVVGVANRSRESSERVAGELNIATVFESPEALAKTGDVPGARVGAGADEADSERHGCWAPRMLVPEG